MAVAGFGEREWHSHTALQFLLAHEPGVVLPALTFQGAERLLGIVAEADRPGAVPLPAHAAGPAGSAEWLARIVLSYGCTPPATEPGAAVAATQTLSSPPCPPSSDQRGPACLLTESMSTTSTPSWPSPTPTRRPEHLVRSDVDAAFTWDYERARPQLGKLYEKAKHVHVERHTDLDWSTPVDQEKVVLANAVANGGMVGGGAGDTFETPSTSPARPSPPGATRSGWSSASSPRTGRCRSSSTASRARWSAPAASWRPSRGSTPSTTPPPR